MELYETFWSCERKRAYATAAEAETARARCQWASGRPLRTYHCDAADHWHLAHGRYRVRVRGAWASA